MFSPRKSPETDMADKNPILFDIQRLREALAPPAKPTLLLLAEQNLSKARADAAANTQELALLCKNDRGAERTAPSSENQSSDREEKTI